MENNKKVQFNLCIPEHYRDQLREDGGTDNPGESGEGHHGGISGNRDHLQVFGWNKRNEMKIPGRTS